MNEYLSYSQLRQLAILNGIKPTKVSVGIWANHQGYMKVRKQIDKVRTTYYYKA